MKIDIDAILRQAAADEGVSEHLPVLRRMLNVESGGNVKAVSPKGARGLMQLIPGTAHAMGVSDPFDPEQNIRGGVRYFKEQLQRFGDPVLAVAAYNAGPENVKKHGGVPPFRETQNYVAKIFGKTEFSGADEVENRFLAKRRDRELYELINFFAPEPDVVSRAIPRYAAGSGLDWLTTLLSRFGISKRQGGEQPKGESVLTSPKRVDIQPRYATEEEWQQADPEGYKQYQEYLHSPEKPGLVRLTPEQWQQAEEQRRESGLPAAVPAAGQEALKEPWADPVNVMAAAGGTAAVAGLKAAVKSLLGNILGESVGGLAGEVTEKEKPAFAWAASLAADMATGMATDKMITKAAQRLQAAIPSLSFPQAEEITRKAVDNPGMQKISKEITFGADIGIGQLLAKKQESTYPVEKAEKFLTEPFQIELKEGKYAVNINLDRIEAPEDITSAIRKMSELEAAGMDAARRGTMSMADIERLADMVGMSSEQLLARRRGQAFSAEEAVASRRLLVSAAAKVKELAAKAASVDGTERDAFELRRAMAVMAGIQQQVAGITAEAGRALASFRIMSKETKSANRMLREWLDAGGGVDATKSIAAKIAALDTPDQIGDVVSRAWRANTWDMFLEAWINGLLSGPVTHVRNVVGNMLAIMQSLPERWLAGKMGSEVADGEAAAMLYGLYAGWTDALRLAWKTLKTGESSDIMGKIDVPHKSISAHSLNISGPVGNAVDLLGEVIRTPSRFLMAEDEFFKAVSYRMELHSQAYRQAVRDGLQGESLTGRIAEILKDPPENIQMAAIDAARYNTFTDEAGPIARSLMGLRNELPALALIVPFIRTPSNIFRYTLSRTPLAPLLKSFREDIKSGGERRDLALARLTMGSMIMAVVTGLAYAGKITGGGPQKKELRDSLLREGWQPYSFKIGDTYYQYGGLDPLGAIIGLGADFSEIGRELSDQQVDQVALMLAASASRVFLNKTYLQGLANAVDAIANPEQHGRTFMQNFARSLVPATGLMATVTRNVDPHMRETRAGRESALAGLQTIINELKGRVPGYSDTLPPRRDLWGEPVPVQEALGPNWLSPVYVSKRKRSPIDLEMIQNEIGVRLPDRQIKGVALTAQEYDRYVQLAGNELKVNGLGCKDFLNNYVKSDAYRSLSPGPDGGRAYTIKDVINRYRRAAAYQVIEEFPELKEAIVKQKGEGL